MSFRTTFLYLARLTMSWRAGCLDWRGINRSEGIDRSAMFLAAHGTSNRTNVFLSFSYFCPGLFRENTFSYPIFLVSFFFGKLSLSFCCVEWALLGRPVWRYGHIFSVGEKSWKRLKLCPCNFSCKTGKTGMGAFFISPASSPFQWSPFSHEFHFSFKSFPSQILRICAKSTEQDLILPKPRIASNFRTWY